MRTLVILLVAVAARVLAHGDHGGSKPGKRPSRPVDPNASWMTKHMAEEHHVGYWDSSSFFLLHDYNGDGAWQGDEIMRTYGLYDESNAEMPPEKKSQVLRDLLDLLDRDGDRTVSREEWDEFIKEGKTLPDMGTGPGHHGDDEYEYEIHHWEKYHDENTKLEDLTHPEDIAHFKKHEEMEAEQERLEQLDKMPIVEENIPQKFLRTN